MNKKFLAVTLVLVLAASFGAVAADEKPLTGSWTNTLTLNPQTSPVVTGFDSDLNVTYVSGGVTYSSTSEFSLTGYTDQEFGVETSVGLLDLSSTANFDPSAPGLDYWSNEATLTLGGVSITDLFLLQNTSNGFGAGMKLTFAGETPGGVSVDVDNYFGMEADDDMDSGYAIVTSHNGSDTTYGPSSLQYVSTVLTLDNLSMSCCDFSNETKFSEAKGFEYSEFEFSMSSTNLPLSLDADLKFEPQTKSIVLTPSLTTEWACFSVYTDLTGTLANNGTKGDTIDALEIEGFAIKEVTLGDVMFSSYTALGSNTVYDLNDAFIDASYDEVFRIEKLAKFDLDFTLDTYFDMTESDSLFDLALFDASASYELSSQFTLGSGLKVKPGSGLDELSLSLDYSW